jgi:hypothetical protein
MRIAASLLMLVAMLRTAALADPGSEASAADLGALFPVVHGGKVGYIDTTGLRA